MSTRLELSTGSEPGDVGTARTFVAAVGRTAGLDDEAVEHLRMAVSEVASAVVEFGLGPIEMLVEVGDRQLTVQTRISARDDRLQSRLALVARLPFESTIDHSSVRLTMTFPEGDA